MRETRRTTGSRTDRRNDGRADETREEMWTPGGGPVPAGLTGMVILQRCREADEDIALIDARIRRQRETMEAMGGMRMDAVGGGKGTPDPDRMGRMMAKLDGIEREKERRERERDAEIYSAGLLVDMLPNLEGEILHQYYVMGLSTGQIGRKMGYTGSYVRKKKTDGEAVMEQIISPERAAGTLPEWYVRGFRVRRGRKE